MVEKEQIPWWQPGVFLFVRLSGWIGGPVLIAVFLGRWLDRKYDTDPWLFLLSVGIAFVVSTVGIIKDSMMELKRIEKEEQAKKNEDKKTPPL